MSLTDEQLASLGTELKQRINANAVEDASADREFRWHLGISIIGQECLRKTWYDFRWFSLRTLKGHQTRIFSVGHDAELAAAEMLTRDGWNVQTRDPATDKQWQYSAAHGHYGGSADGIISCSKHNMQIDVRHVFADKILLECKTHNTGSFSGVASKGVREAKPQHYTQMCGYGLAFNLDYGLYFAMNKNDGDIHTEFVRLNHEHARTMELRAESIITAREPPPRVSNKATYYLCKMCDHTAVCHNGGKPVQHCRSCSNSYPVDAGEWFCSLYQQNIPRDVVRKGCPQFTELK